MVVKTFRGQLADGGQDRIRLQTNNGKMGYRIVKLELCLATPNLTNICQVFKIFKNSQSSFTATINLTDSDLLAIGYIEDDTARLNYPAVIIFDNEIFNQDIFISKKEVGAGTGELGNYYLELEVIPLDDAGAEYTTLKDMRQS